MPFIWTRGLNDHFRADDSRRNALLICASGSLDLLTTWSFYRFVRYSATYRLVLCMGSFYSLRVLCQALFKVERPEGYDWDYPGVFSIFVPYGRTSDFFYSGHVGICNIFMLEFWTVGWPYSAIYAFTVMLLQIFTMLALRAHYTIDMFAGIVFSHYLFIISEKYVYLIDWHLFGIPIEKRMAYSRSDLSDDDALRLYRKQLSEYNLDDDNSGADQPTTTKAEQDRILSASNNYISRPSGGVGNYFVTCRNCM